MRRAHEVQEDEQLQLQKPEQIFFSPADGRIFSTTNRQQQEESPET